MKKTTEIICGCATLIFLTATTVWLFCFSKINNNCTTMGINIGLLITAPIFVYLLLSYMVNKGLPVPLFIIVLVLSTGGGAFLFIKSVKLEPFSLGTVIVMCVIYCLSFIVSAFITYDPVKESGIITRFDLSVFLLIILLVVNKWLHFPAYKTTVIACLISLAASIIALIAIRSGKYSSGKEQIQGNRHAVAIMLAAVSLVLAAFSATIYYFAAGSIENTAGVLAGTISWLAGLVKTVAAFIWNCINRFFTWIVSLFNPMELENADVSMDSVQMTAAESDTFSVRVPIWFYVILGAVLLLIIVLIIIKFRKKRFRKSAFSDRNIKETTVRTSHLKAALLALFRKIKATLLFKINCIRYKNSIPGLIILCSQSAAKELSWKQSESAAYFIRRFANHINKQLALTEPTSPPKNKNKEGFSVDALYQLAELSEKQFYSGKPIEIPADLYPKIKTVLKQYI